MLLSDIFESDSRYLVTPIGLSYSSLLQAAIVAQRNKGPTVTDKTTGEVIPPKTLKAEIAKVKKKTPTVKAETVDMFS